MKKLALLLLGVLLGFLLCYYLNGKKGADDMTDDQVENPKPPKGYIEPGDMITLNNAFNQRHTIINKALNIDDNRSSWYGLEQMRNFLDYAEFKAKGTEYPMDGVRIYLGANSGAKGLTTMFLVPTSSAIQTRGSNQKGSMFSLNLSARAGGGDIPGAGGLDYGGQGDPPGSGYPNPPQ